MSPIETVQALVNAMEWYANANEGSRRAVDAGRALLAQLQTAGPVASDRLEHLVLCYGSACKDGRDKDAERCLEKINALAAPPSVPSIAAGLRVLNALEVLERMDYRIGDRVLVENFLRIMGKRGMWVIESALAAAPAPAERKQT